ncbi:MAG: hypothetical protein U0804_13775 [Gemmataceae bacterium]
MSRRPFVAAGLLFLSAAAVGQPDPADPVTQALARAQDEYVAATGKAQEKLLAAFAAQQKALEDTKKLKVADQIRLLDQVKAERKAFEASPAALPASAVMRPALAEYQAKLVAARRKCEAAFDRAAEDYRDRKNLDAARAVLARKAEFFAAASPADQRVEWVGKKKAFRRNDKGLWYERNEQGLFFVFDEAGRTPEAVELLRVGPPRVAVRLYADKATMSVNKGEWLPLDDGAWVAPKQ